MRQKREPTFIAYLSAVVVIFFLTLSAADSIGLVPCEFDDTCPAPVNEYPLADNYEPIVSMPTRIENSAISAPPKRIKIEAIGLDLPVQNPMTTDLAALDLILKNGPARHSLSGLLGDERNMIIFGHSSHLPIVHNKMYQAFNRVPDLQKGQAIEVDGEDGQTYVYSIISVEKADASNFDENFLGSPEKKLIIVTCDTLTSKSSRYIVRADFVGTLSL